MSQELIFGLGQGLFAVVVTTAIAILIAMVGSYLAQNSAIYICIACLTLPFIVFGIYASAPRPDTAEAGLMSGGVNLYHDAAMPTGNVVDRFYPVRVTMIILLGLGALLGIGYRLVVLTLKAPPFQAPRIECRRRQIEALQPAWHQ